MKENKFTTLLAVGLWVFFTGVICGVCNAAVWCCTNLHPALKVLISVVTVAACFALNVALHMFGII